MSADRILTMGLTVLATILLIFQFTAKKQQGRKAHILSGCALFLAVVVVIGNNLAFIDPVYDTVYIVHLVTGSMFLICAFFAIIEGALLYNSSEHQITESRNRHSMWAYLTLGSYLVSVLFAVFVHIR